MKVQHKAGRIDQTLGGSSAAIKSQHPLLFVCLVHAQPHHPRLQPRLELIIIVVLILVNVLGYIFLVITIKSIQYPFQGRSDRSPEAHQLSAIFGIPSIPGSILV